MTADATVMPSCEAITPDGVCGDTAQLRHWDTETNGRAELYLCGEHWRMWLKHLTDTDDTP